MGRTFVLVEEVEMDSGLGILVENNGRVEHPKIIFYFRSVKMRVAEVFFQKLPSKRDEENFL